MCTSAYNVLAVDEVDIHGRNRDVPQAQLRAWLRNVPNAVALPSWSILVLPIVFKSSSCKPPDRRAGPGTSMRVARTATALTS